MTRLVGTTLGLALLATAAPALAQTAPRETFPAVSVVGFPRYIDPASGKTPPMRRADAIGDLTAWLPDNDPSVVLNSGSADSTGGVALSLTVDGFGKVIACDASQVHGDKRLSDGLCDRVSARARFTPAIDDSGARLTDEYIYNLSFNRTYVAQTPVVRVQGLSPAPPVAGASWPPVGDPLQGSVTKLDLLEGGPASAQARAEPWAGIIYAPEDPKNPCRIVKSSGDAAFNERACKAAAKGRYDFAGVAEAYRRRMVLHFVLDRGKPRALTPAQKWSTRPQPTDQSLAAIAGAVRALPADQAARLRLNVDVDAAGAVTRCAIEGSSGTDAGGVAVCAAVRAAASFLPAQDIFGRPFPARLYDWSPLAAKP